MLEQLLANISRVIRRILKSVLLAREVLSIRVKPTPIVELHKTFHRRPVMVFDAFSVDSDIGISIVCGLAMGVVRINGRQNISRAEPLGVYNVDLCLSFNVKII